jgi:hypothetical protein
MEGAAVPTGLGWYERVDEELRLLKVHKDRLLWLQRVYEEQRGSILEKIAWHEEQLRVAMHLAKNALGKSSLECPNGKAAIRKSPGRLEVSNEPAAIVWARLQLSRPDLIRIKESIDKAALRHLLKDAGEGALADPETGEVLPFVRLEGAGEMSLSYGLRFDHHAGAAVRSHRRGSGDVQDVSSAVQRQLENEV